MPSGSETVERNVKASQAICRVMWLFCSHNSIDPKKGEELIRSFCRVGMAANRRQVESVFSIATNEFHKMVVMHQQGKNDGKRI